MRPYSANFKAVIINEAHLMNQEAQGALLKTLEEPKGNTIIILISSSPEHLLPTILSRVEMIKFYPVNKAEMKSFLKGKGVPEQKIAEISNLSYGKPGTAYDFVSDSEKLKNIYLKIEELEKISGSDTAVRFQYAKDICEDNNNLKEILDIWLNYFRGLLLENVRTGDLPQKKYNLAKLKKIIKTIQSSKLLISSTNASSRLVVETLMLEL
jgi:DNA polymerase-3 subunit delta'